MKTPHIMCIAPYEGMYEIMQNIAAHRSDVKMSVYLGDMEEGVAVVRKHINEDIDVIVSRGHTGDLIYSNFLFPVCSITFSPYDILRAIRAALELTSRFAILGPKSLTENARLLCESLQYNDVLIETVTDADDLMVRLLHLKNIGCALVVGDRITVNTAQKLGLLHILIISGENSIKDAINQAVRLYRFGETIRQRALLMERVLRSQEDATMIYDSLDHCVFFSPDSLPDSIRRLSESRLAEIRKQKNLNLTVCDGGQYYSIKAKTLSLENESEYVSFLIKPFAPKLVTASGFSIHGKTDLEESERHFFWGRSQKIASFLDMAVRVFNASHRVCITGKQDSDMYELASYLHLHSSAADMSFVCLDCGKISPRQWSFFLESSDSPFYRNELSLYLQRIDLLTEKQCAQLSAFLESSASGPRFFVILSTPEPSASPVFRPESIPGFMQLVIPSLREHPEDIGEIASLYINQVGSRHGKQIIGLSPDALRLLQEYTPLDTIAVLKRCLYAVVLTTESAYINVKQLQFVLQQICPPSSDRFPPAENALLDLNRPLKQIERDIIYSVYQRAGMNQAKAARILGISRSTLWRILSADTRGENNPS